MSKTNKDYQREFKKRMRESGMVQVQSWVPKERKAELDAFVARLKSSEVLSVRTL